MTDSIKTIIMQRDNLTAEQADDAIEEAKVILNEYLDANDLEAAENVCNECFGLEPDYLMELV